MAIEKLLVNTLGLFTTEEYSSLLTRCEIDLTKDEEKQRIEVLFLFFGAITAKELQILSSFINPVISFRVELKFLYDNEDIASLLTDYAAISNQSTPFCFRANNITFDCPELIFHIEESTKEKIENYTSLISLFRDPLCFLFSASNFSIKLHKNNEESNDLQKGVYRLFHIEEIKSRYTKDSDLSLGITDYKKQYLLILRAKNKKDALGSLELQKDRWYDISFQINDSQNNYDGHVTRIGEAQMPEHPVRQDLSEHKVCCTSLHTKLSAFDGLFDFKDFAKEASLMGHTAIGITDFFSVQSYIEVEAVSKDLGIKPLYGCEFEVVPERVEIVSFLPPQVDKKEKNTFSIFDIETTGLYPATDEMIEISIMKFEDGIKVGEYHSYLTTSNKLKPEIIKLTKITDEILKSQGRDPALVLDEVKEFVKDTIMVAHNGYGFDYPFINAQYLKLNKEPLNNPLIDTLFLSKGIFAEQKVKSHSLSAVAKRCDCQYDEEESHSATYDAKLLSDIFAVMSRHLCEKGVDVNQDVYPLNTLFKQEDLLKNYYGHNILVYAKNQKGIKAIYKLVSLGHTSRFFNKTTLFYSDLDEHREDILIVNSTVDCPLFASVLQHSKESFLKQCSYFDYICLPPPSHFEHEYNRNLISREDTHSMLKTLYEWSKPTKKKVFFSYCAKYLRRENQEQFMVIFYAKNIGGKRHKLYSYRGANDVLPNYAFRTTAELLSEFEFLGLKADTLHELSFVNNLQFINQIEDGIVIAKTKLHSPTIPGVEKMMQEKIDETVKLKYGSAPDQYIYNKIEKELSRIISNGFSVVYWTSHLLVKKSVDDGYLVGSRGSVGSSFVAHLLGISEVNPLPPHYYCSDCSFFEVKEDFLESGVDLDEQECPNCHKPLQRDGHNIPFETFLGLNADKVPDIDLNFSGEYQSTAHNFLREMFGDDRTFRSGTINTVANKTAFALAFNYLNDNKISYNNGKLTWLSQQVRDVKRTSGQHPGGILIIPGECDVYDFTPINYPANDPNSDWLTTHLEFHDLHDALFKFDALGHDDPTFLALLQDLTGIDPRTVSYSDKKILSLFNGLDAMGLSPKDIMDETVGTIGLPEFGTLLTRKILRACEIKSFADLIRISGISHGTNVWKGNIDALIKKKKFKLNQVITCRDDIMLYLNSCGLEFGDSFKISESVRKGKGIPKEYVFLLKEKKVPEWYLESANKISYIFPKAHATAYVLMSWKIAYFKLYRPLEFYATYFSIHSDFFDIDLLIQNNPSKVMAKYNELKSKLAEGATTPNTKNKFLMMIFEVSLEMMARGIKFKNIDINASHHKNFLAVKEENTIQIPFISIDGLGKIVALDLYENREKHGPFSGRKDLESRTKLNTTHLAKLEAIGVIGKKGDDSQLSIESFFESNSP